MVESKPPPAKSSSVRVQATNDDCNLSKRSAAELGYYADDFVQLMTGKPARRTPLINRGYFIRVHILRKTIVDVARKLKQNGCRDLQVVSLGAGYDTTFFQLISGTDFDGLSLKYCEVDYPALLKRKLGTIEHYEQFRDLLQEKGYNMSAVNVNEAKKKKKKKKKAKNKEDEKPEEESGTKTTEVIVDGGAGDNQYLLLGQDLRELKVFEKVLSEQCGIDFRKPTVFISECVFNYIRPKCVHSLLRWIPKVFQDALIFAYDQLHPEDAFGATMMHSLHQRGSPLLAIGDFGDCEAVGKRYLEHGWAKSSAISMSDCFYLHLEQEKFDDIERRELFDEYEDWHIKCCHYAFSWALSNATGVLSNNVASVLPEKRITHQQGISAPRLSGLRTTSEYELRVDTKASTLDHYYYHGGDGDKSEVPGRWGHAACLSGGNNNKLLVFGGFGKGMKAHQRLNDVVEANVNANDTVNGSGSGSGSHHQAGVVSGLRRHYPQLEKVQDKLFRRMYHSVAATKDGGFVSFGGRSGPNQLYNDLICVSVNDQNHDQLSFSAPVCKGETPSKRSRHTMTKLGNRNLFLVFGGWDGRQARNDFCLLEVSDDSEGEGGYTWHPVVVKGDPVAARFGHSLDLVEWRETEAGGHEFHLLLYGGYDGRHNIFGSIYSIRVSFQGSMASASSKLLLEHGPEPRYSHASFVKDRVLFVIGGVTVSSGDTCCAYSFSLDDCTWSKVKLSSDGSDYDLQRHVWTRQQAILLPSPSAQKNEEETTGAGDVATIALVGGGILCFSFGSMANPIITVLRLIQGTVVT